MEEDEITNSVEGQVSMVEPKDEEEAEVSEKCGTVLIAGISSECLSPEKKTEEVVAAVAEREDDAVENVKKLEFEGAVMEELAVAPDDGVIMETEEEERNEGENVEVLKSEDAEVVDNGVKVDEVEMEMERSMKGGDEEGIVEELRLDYDKVEVSGERRDGLGSMDGDGGVKAEELEMKMEKVIEKPNLDNENGGQGSREGEVIVNADEGLAVGEQAEKKEQLVGEDGSEGAEKGEVMPGEEGGVRAEKEEEMVGKEGGEGAKKGEVILGKEGGEGAEKGEVMVGEEGGEGVREEEDVEGRGEEMEDSAATGDGEVSTPSPVVAEEETPIADTEMETESSVVKSGSGGKRRRGRIPKASTPVKVPARKTVGEDVCFICLDGGDLVLCDRRFVCFFLL